MNPLEELIFRSEYLEVFLRRGDPSFRLVTFSEMGVRANGQHWWGAAVARTLGLSALGFVAKAPNWFPASAMRDALAAPAVRDAIAAIPRRVSYGFSMGAYAAIKYARALGTEAVVALAPQWSIDPADTKGVDWRFGRHFDRTLNEGMAITSDDVVGRVYLVHDPRERFDHWHAERIGAAVRDAETVKAYATGHYVASALASSEAAGEIFRAALAGEHGRLQAAVARQRRGWDRRASVLARQAAGLRPSAALRIARRQLSASSAEELEHIYHIAGQALLRRGLLSEAADCAAALDACSPGSFLATDLQAEVAFRAGRVEEALALARRAVELAPDRPGPGVRLASFLRRAGRNPAVAAPEA